MGYNVRITDSEFFIHYDHHKILAKLLKDNFPKEFGDCFKNLDSIMSEIDWDLKYDDNDNIVGIRYEREIYYPEHLAIFDFMACWVEQGSYIEFAGEDGEKWRWVFDGKNAKEIKPKIIWE